MSEKWIVTPRPNPRARTRLFCFHPAGNGASMFVPWATLLPEEVELNIIQLPGRENRLRETPINRIESVINELDEVAFPLLDRPFAIFGVSMGALIGFEFARRLRQTYNIEPTHIYAASRRAPQTPDRFTLISQLPNRVFLDTIQSRYHCIPEVIWKDEELMRLFLPLLRADFALLENYTYQAEPPFTCPLTALYGNEDETTNSEDISGWRLHTKADYTQQMFDGGHFFITKQNAGVVSFMVQQGLGLNGR